MQANNPLTDAALAELDRLHAAATPGQLKYGFWEDDREIGVPEEDGPTILLGTLKRVADAKWLCRVSNAYPALRQRLTDAESRLAEAERERDELQAALEVERVATINRDAQQRREGAAEWLERAGRLELELTPAEFLQAAKRLREEK